MKLNFSSFLSGSAIALALLSFPETANAQPTELGFGQPTLITGEEASVTLNEPVIIHTESGRLDAGDHLGDSGKFEQIFEVSVSGGTTVMFDLTSLDYDTFISIENEDGDSLHNDDIDGEPKHSRLLMSFDDSTEVLVLSLIHI